jgi:hypothetical protein
MTEWQMTVDLGPNVVALIDRCADNTGLSKEDVLRLALLLFDQVSKNEAEGGYAVLVDQYGSKTKLVFPTQESA